MLRVLTRYCLILALVATGVSSVDAQPSQTGTVSGEVKDSTGAVIPGVDVTLTSQDRGFARSAVSDANGRFRATDGFV